MAESLAAIILAGGASSRMGRDKASLVLSDGQTLLGRTLAAVRSAGATELVVAGDDPGAASQRAPSSAADVVFVREDPPRSGPVPALDAALEQVTAGLVLVLPCDLADPAVAVAQLVRAAGGLRPGQDGLVAVDDGGRRQHLTALFRTAALRRGSGARSGRVRDRVAGLSLTQVPEPADQPGIWADLDTPEDLERARPGGAAPGDSGVPDIPDTPDIPDMPDIPGLGSWLHAVARDLDLPASVVVPGPLLDVARDVARGVIRPGAPTTTYLIGIAVGRSLAGGRESPAAIAGLVDRLSARVQDLALSYRPEGHAEDHAEDRPVEGDRP